MSYPDQSIADFRRLAREAALGLTPTEARRLIDDTLTHAFDQHLRSIDAEGGTMWVVSEDGGSLVAVLNPWEPEIRGIWQPLDTGLIGMAYFLERGIGENEVKANPSHATAIDERLEKETAALVAAPLYVAETLRGVVSAVRFAGSPRGSFTAEHVQRHERGAEVLGRLLESNLLRRLLAS